jgi:hypothetical protein
MTNFTIRPVRTKADEKQFLAFLYTFYQADPYWVAPLRLERKKLIDRQHNPFYHHEGSGQNDVKMHAKTESIGV